MSSKVSVATVGEVVRPTRPRVKPADYADLPFIGMEHIEAHTMKLVGTVSAGTMKSSAVHFKPGDVLYGRLRPYLNKVYRPAFDGLCSAEFIVLPENERIDGGYLQYFLNSPAFVRFASRLNTGDRPRVDFDQLAPYKIPLPPLSEQRRIIAEIEKQFSRLDDALANLQRASANLKRYKAAVLKAAVEGNLVPTEAELARGEGRVYETGQALLRRVLQIRRSQWKGNGRYEDPVQPNPTGLPHLPEGWAWARLDAVALIKGGITVDKNRKDPTARPVPYLRVANVQRGYLDLEEIKLIDAPEVDINELRLVSGDILFNEGGDRDKLGRGWIWEGQLPECIHQNHVFRARPFSSDVSGKLVSWWGNTFGKDYFLREGKQTTNLASINMTKLSAFPVPIAPLAEQGRIIAEVDRRLSIADGVEAEVGANLTRGQALRHAALERAFSAQSGDG